MKIQSNNRNWIKIIDKLVVDNCLTFGQNPKLTNKKFTKYIFGTRGSLEVFNFYELRHLLLKVYPLIQSLFYKTRRNHDPMDKFIPSKKKEKKKKDLYLKKNPYTIHRIKKDRFSVTEIHKIIPPQILFASITPIFASILESAATTCQMPWHQNRWLSGAITAAISYLTDKQKWNFCFDPSHSKASIEFTQKYSFNKENIESIKEKTRFHALSRWPSLVIIPDVANNPMIVSEAKKIGVPVMGLVNSACQLDIDYPIFAQDTSIHTVHFFCHFVAALIAKEMIQIQHKLFATRKTGILKKGKLQLKKSTMLANKKPMIFSFQKLVARPRMRLRRLVKTRLTYIDLNEFDYLIDLLDGKKRWQQKKPFLKNRKYLFSFFNSILQRVTLSPINSDEMLTDLENQKRKMLNKRKLHWTDKEQKRAFLKTQTNFTTFEKILQVQWIRKGRLRYNNVNKDYYWKPLRLMVQTPYRFHLRKSVRRKWRSAFPFRKKVYRYQRYKRSWCKKFVKYFASKTLRY
jgi:ribosomal protein S2